MTELAAPELKLTVYEAPSDLPVSLRHYCQSPEETGTETWWFKHPHYVTMFPVATPCEIEGLIEFRKSFHKENLAKRNWGGVFAGLERAFRMDYLVEYATIGEFLDAEEDPREAVTFWRLARHMWSDGEHDEASPIWSRLMNVKVPHRDFMTSARDRRALRAMPDVVTVHRGVQFPKFSKPSPLEAANAGWAWTFSENTAEWFAKRFAQAGDHCYVVTSEVPKSMIAAYITQRAEEEVLIEPGSVDPSTMLVRPIF